MAASIDSYLTDNEDEYRPLNPKPYLQRYDNYQIYDINCIDITSEKIADGTRTLKTEEKVNCLGVQAYSPCPILWDFNQIVNQYP